MSHGPESPEVQAILVRWHQHLRYFYEPSLEVLRGLGNAYKEHPDFNATFTAIHPDSGVPPEGDHALRRCAEIDGWSVNSQSLRSKAPTHYLELRSEWKRIRI
jgi:hypothetical protein